MNPYLLQQVSPGEPVWLQLAIGGIAAILLANKILDFIKGKTPTNGNGKTPDAEKVAQRVREQQKADDLSDCMKRMVGIIEGRTELFREVSNGLHKLSEQQHEIAVIARETLATQQRSESKLARMETHLARWNCPYSTKHPMEENP